MSKMIADDDRMQWMWDNFGGGDCSTSLKFENYFYTILHDSCKDWNGGWFDMFEEKNGAKWLCIGSPARKEMYHVIGAGNQYEGDMSGEALCIGAMIIATNHMLWYYASKSLKLYNLYYNLYTSIRNFAMKHKEVKEIWQFID